MDAARHQNEAAAPWKAYVVLAVGIVATSLAAIFIRLAQNEGIPSLLIAASRLFIAALILAIPTIARHTSHILRPPA